MLLVHLKHLFLLLEIVCIKLLMIMIAIINAVSTKYLGGVHT